MKKFIILLFIITACNQKPTKIKADFTTVFEKTNGAETATYDETIKYYTDLAKAFSSITIQTIGETDSGKPLHLVTLNPDQEFDFEKIRKNKEILLINNGIHPGESDGIDATMMLFRDLAQGTIDVPKNTVLVTIPIYNIGGSLNRNKSTRTNQNGPKEYGFRGNARNYDLNRDFIKNDTKNARTFAQLFHLIKPSVFIDNHVSNGADYQYTLTHLFTQHNKLGGAHGTYIHTEMMPKLEQKLIDKEWAITPYVNVFNRTPETGFSQFMDWPRYSTGYTTLFNTLGMMVETHMLKPYKQRVEGTYELMKSMLEIIETDSEIIRKNNTEITIPTTYTLDWEIDTTKVTTLQFKGFEGTSIPSAVTGAKRLKYDRDKPYTRAVNYQNYYKPKTQITVPKAYIIPQGWYSVIDLLKLNDVAIFPFEKDTIVSVTSYKIDQYKTRTSAYEGHYSHYNTSVISTPEMRSFRKGDFIVYTNQKAVRYLLETLEPEARDSFFNWNFFDAILQQKEGFSPYVWEDIAESLLASNDQLRKAFETKKELDTDFANNWYAQLDWLHKQSEYYEKAHLQYPIYRID